MSRAYIGTYTKKDSQGIYKVELSEEGKVSSVEAVAKVDNPTYLAFSNNNKSLYSVSKIEDKGAVSSFKVKEDGSLELLTSVGKEGNPPCYVEVSKDNKYLLSANYHTGTVDSYSILQNGELGELLSTDAHEGSSVHPRQEKPHVHFSGFTPDGEYVFTCDLGTDEVTTYKLNKGILTKVENFKVKAGSGVRHIVFTSDNKKAFVMTELTSEVISFDYDGKGKLSNPKYYPTLPSDFNGEDKGDCLEQIQTISTFGKDPRDFNLNKDNTLAIATNETSGTITVYKVDKTTGKLDCVEKDVVVPEAVCVQFI